METEGLGISLFFISIHGNIHCFGIPLPSEEEICLANEELKYAAKQDKTSNYLTNISI